MRLVRAVLRAVSVTLLVTSSGGSSAAQSPDPLQASLPPKNVVILELAQDGGESTPAQRETLEMAILDVARAADVVLCLNGRPSISESALESLCARPDSDVPLLRWQFRMEMSRVDEVDLLRLSLELEAGNTISEGTAQLVVVSSTPLPAEGRDTDLLVAEKIKATIIATPQVREWFGSLQYRPALARPWPSATLASGGPTPSIGDREGSPKSPGSAKGEKKPEVRTRIEIEGTKDTPSQAPSASDLFLIREALVGGGFSRGVTGKLRVSLTGLGFTPDGKSREEWSIAWRDLKEVGKDTGVWDVSYPLLIVDQTGRRRYIARIDAKGSYLPGDAILASIRQKRPAKAADEKVTEVK